MTGHPVGFNSPFNCSCKKQLQFIFKYHSASVSEKSHIHVCYLLFIKVDPVMMLSSSITTTTRMFSVLSCKHTPDITWCYDHNRQTSTSMLKTSIWHTANYIATTAEQNTKFYDNCRNSRALIGLILLSICGQTHKFEIHATRQQARAGNSTIFYRKKQIDVSF